MTDQTKQVHSQEDLKQPKVNVEHSDHTSSINIQEKVFGTGKDTATKMEDDKHNINGNTTVKSSLFETGPHSNVQESRAVEQRLADDSQTPGTTKNIGKEGKDVCRDATQIVEDQNKSKQTSTTKRESGDDYDVDTGFNVNRNETNEPSTTKDRQTTESNPQVTGLLLS